MEKEQYVSFEISQLLKEKGFDWEVFTCCDEISKFNRANTSYNWNNANFDVDVFSVPTQQMACRWLREVHNIFIGVGIGEDIDGEFGYMPFIHILDNLSCSDGRYVPHVDADQICYSTPETYEEAVEIALGYCLTDLI